MVRHSGDKKDSSTGNPFFFILYNTSLAMQSGTQEKKNLHKKQMEKILSKERKYAIIMDLNKT